MSNPEVVSYAGYIKQGVAELYARRGPHFGRAVARAYMYEIAQVVTEVDGAAVAAGMLFHATDATLARIPLHELEVGPGYAVALKEPQQPATAAQAEQAEWAAKWAIIKVGMKRAAGWWLVGILTYQPFAALLRWVLHW